MFKDKFMKSVYVLLSAFCIALLLFPSQAFSSDCIIYDNSKPKEISSNSPVELTMGSSSGGPPFNWRVSGTGFHFGSIDGPVGGVTNDNSNTVNLWAHAAACGAEKITVFGHGKGGSQTTTSYVRHR